MTNTDVGRLAWRVFTRGHGLTLQADAADMLRQRVGGADVPADRLERVLARVATACKQHIGAKAAAIVSPEALSAVLDELAEAAGAEECTAATSGGFHVRVVAAGECPRWTYDVHARVFRERPAGVSPLPRATARAEMYRERYAALCQRVLRVWNDTAAWSASLVGGECALPSALSTTGVKGALAAGEDDSVCLFGMLSALAEDEVHLEDLDAAIRLVFDTPPSPSLLAETCFVIVSGSVKDRALHVRAMWTPPTETRAAALAAGAPDIAEAVLGRDGLDAALAVGARHRDAAAAIVLADVHLDDASVLARLERLLCSLAAPPPALVLMGPLSSRQAADLSLDGLADVIARCGGLRGCRVVIVPAAGDFGGPDVLPVPAVPRAVAEDERIGGVLLPLRRAGVDAVLASNPCRVLFFGREIFVLAHRSAPSALTCARMPFGTLAKDPSLSDAAAHVLAQGCVLPVPLRSQAVYWEGATPGLGLYPPPDVLVLGGNAGGHCVAGDTLATCPGSFTAASSFAVVYPLASRADVCVVRG